MRNSNEATLRNHGMDTSKYLSLHIDKAVVPEGAEVVVMVRDASGKQHAVPAINPQLAPRYAHNSRFYERVMEDGYIFNPRMHRRFIAAQFRRLVQRHGYLGLIQGVAESYNWTYAIGMLRKEVHVLANLARHDANAYTERAQFFTMDRCAKILDAYANAVSKYIDRYLAKNSDNQAYIPGYGMLKRHNERPMKHRFTQLAKHAGECTNYAKLDNLLNTFDWLELPKDELLPYSFVEPYVEAGAFYTLKHHMMFEELSMYGKNQRQSLSELRKYDGSYFSLYQHLMS